MKKRRVKKSVVKFFLRIVSIIIIVYFFVVSFSYIIKLRTLAIEEKELNNTLVELKENEEKLKTDIVKLNDKEYIARYAREHYLYTKDGEIALKIDEEDEDEIVLEDDSNYKYIYIGLACAFVILVIVFVNHKRKKK